MTRPSTTKPDRLTKRWIRNAADEHAAAHGYRFDAYRADHVCEFIEQNCRLYEGESAGQPLRLMPWQIEILSRIFGWCHHSTDWRRNVRRFKIASVWIPKKNGKSPTAAAVALYLLVADAEAGNKVYLAAKDAKQARIMYDHAAQMVKQSPDLATCCKIHDSYGRITHPTSASMIAVLSADNHDGQEGRNGSVIIDETHVVDDRTARILEYAGASRSEPLRFEVSTAGTNPTGYGARQRQYGAAVNAGEVIDPGFFFAEYAAPQTATDADLAKPAVWRAANPAWGYIIKPAEFKESYRRARRTPADFAAWKMYRLNVWQAATNPWLPADAWQACTDHDTKPQGPQILGLDLSKTRDMTAAAIITATENSEPVLRCHFWLPEETARNHADRAPFLNWARHGWLTLTPGNVVDYQRVETDILAAVPDLDCIVFDPLFAEELTQRLSDQTGAERLAFKQTWLNFAGPTRDLERHILAKTLHHDGNPILAWQAAHAKTRHDPAGNVRIIKPTPDDIRKVDGIIATIMALSQLPRLTSTPSTGNYYAQHDPEFV